MTEAIAFPDVEAMLVAYLGDLLDVPASTAIPNPRPKQFLRLLRTGGPRSNLVTDDAQITVEAWANTTTEASDLAKLARAHVGALTGRRIDGVDVGRIEEFSGPAALPDPTSGQARYTWTVSIPVRGAAL